MIIKELTKSYTTGSGGVQIEVFSNLSLEVPEQQITVILGPSGCGKTTLLNIIAGLIGQDSGEITRDTSDESISFIFQEPRLLPWMSVSRNIDLILQGTFPDKVQRNNRINQFLDLVGLDDCANRYPDDLSGGMKQRVSI
ncbi:MAG: ATP-binding cassette domain-containing protein, partial [Spirochaetales bacterium]|nr:ATP-binding cassette domain-containing protein [Spirochaetales bacterium]